MPYCIKCGKELAQDDKFCPRCGTKVQKIEPGAQTLARARLVVKNNIFYGVITPSTIALRFSEYADKVVKSVTRSLSMYR